MTNIQKQCFSMSYFRISSHLPDTHTPHVCTDQSSAEVSCPAKTVSYLTVVLVRSILKLQVSSPSRAGASYLQSRSISTPDPEINSILQEDIINFKMVMHLSLKSPPWLWYLRQYLISVNKFLSSIPGLPFPNFTRTEVPPQNPTSFTPGKRSHVSPGNSVPSQRPPLKTCPQGTAFQPRTAPSPALTLLDP